MFLLEFSFAFCLKFYPRVRLLNANCRVGAWGRRGGDGVGGAWGRRVARDFGDSAHFCRVFAVLFFEGRRWFLTDPRWDRGWSSV